MLTARTAAVAPIRLVRSLPLPAPEPSTTCSGCHLLELCLAGELAGVEMRRLQTLGFSRRRLKEGQSLFREGDSFNYLYAVRSGTFKSYIGSRDGREHVSAFHMAGEMMGLDGLANGRHASASVALEDAEICAIPYQQLASPAVASLELQHVISRLMSREIVREHSLMMLLAGMSADERLGAFLLNISQRMKARGYSATEFHLRMSRADIGSYLGMTLETVSRTFSGFQQQGLLEVDKKHVRIVDLDGLGRAFEASLQ